MKFLIMLFLVSSCASSTMVMSPDRNQYAPKGHQPMGQVKYLNNGLDYLIDLRRNDAYKQMYTACDGEYEILSESNQAQGKTISNNGFGGLSVNDSFQYVFINFKCLPQNERRPASPVKKDCGVIGNLFGCN